MILRCCLLLLIFFTFSTVQATEEKPSNALIKQSHTKAKGNPLKVVATIRPIHSLLSFIMQGSGKPILLLDQTQSAHHYSLRPSQRSTLAHADIVFWIGESLEGFMPRVLNSLPKKVQIIELMDSKGLRLLKPRSASDSSAHDHSHSHESIDPHIWLSIDNALVLASKITSTLVAVDPTRKVLYSTNLAKLRSRLIEQKTNITKAFNNASFKYVVYHDAFQYFENQIGLVPLTAISTDEEQAPGIRHLHKVNNLISKHSVACLIYNTPVLPAIARNLIKNKKTQIIQLDPLGNNLKTGPDLYFELLNSLADGYQQCRKKN